MRYQKAINVWALEPDERKLLQRGQWGTAGRNGAKGVWIGQKDNGVDVVMWHGNAMGRRSYRDYFKNLISYANN